MSERGFTGQWHCPLCAAVIPVTIRGTYAAGMLTFVETPEAFGDAYAHLWSEHDQEGA